MKYIDRAGVLFHLFEYVKIDYFKYVLYIHSAWIAGEFSQLCRHQLKWQFSANNAKFGGLNQANCDRFTVFVIYFLNFVDIFFPVFGLFSSMIVPRQKIALRFLHLLLLRTVYALHYILIALLYLTVT